MRNVFDQYSQPENRLTHALLATLDADRRLLRAFLGWVGRGQPTGRLIVAEQSLPGDPPSIAAKDELERRGLPDGWIYDTKGWALLVESKVAAVPSIDQIERHLRTARRRGFQGPSLLWLTVVPVPRRSDRNVVNRTWAEVYRWLVRQGRRSEWARRAAQYFEVAEVQADMKAQLRESTLTEFTGVPFDADNPYNYSQAKRLLGLLRDELRLRADLARSIGMNKTCPGRGAITGSSGTGVWDFISIRASKFDDVFTQNLHLTLGISDERVDAYVTVPNGIRSRLRNALLGDEYLNFHAVIEETTKRLNRALRKYPGSRPLITLVQRRYATQRSPARHDAVLRFDPRTAISIRARAGEPAVHLQPQWLIATEQALRHRKANLQLQIGAEFPYEKCKITHSDRLVDAVAEVWIACKPVVRAIAGE